VIGYQITASNGDVYLVLVNADTKARDFALGTDLERFRKADVLVDGERAGISNLTDPKGISWTETGLRLDALTATVLRLSTKEEAENPVLPNRPEYHTPVSPSPEKVLPPQTVKPTSQLLAQKKEEPEVQALAPHPDSASVEHGEEASPARALPETGEASSNLTSLAGLLLLGGLGLGMAKNGRKEE
jgi:pullulanase